MTQNDSFHNNLLELIAKNKPFIQDLVQFTPNRILTNRYFHHENPDDNYELDIYTLSTERQSAIFEIKSHSGLRSTFTGKQYHRIYKYHPKSQIWLIYPNIPYNLDLNDLHCERFQRLGRGEIEYI